MKKTLFSLLWLPLLCGCVFHSYIPVDEFDLCVADAGCRRGISVQEFRNDSISGPRFTVREADGRVRRLDSSRWVEEPGELVSRALGRALSSDKYEMEYSLRGNVCNFEFDAKRSVFLFSGTYVIGDGKFRHFRIDVPVNDQTPVSIVAAASVAVNQLAARIASGIK